MIQIWFLGPIHWRTYAALEGDELMIDRLTPQWMCVFVRQKGIFLHVITAVPCTCFSVE